MLAVVPARGGSKGIPKKNTRLFRGLPLVAHTLTHALTSRLITDVVLSTDSKDIAQIAAEHDVAVVDRPLALAGDEVPMMPVVEHAVLKHEADAQAIVWIVVILQPTSPLREPADIDGAIQMLIDTGLDCVVSVAPSREHPTRAKRIADGVLKPYFAAEPSGGLRQSLPLSWRRNGAVYVLRRAKGFDPDPVRSSAVVPYIMPLDRSIDIDDPLDLEIAEWMASRVKAAVTSTPRDVDDSNA